MALVPMRLLLDHAAENGYGLPAYNVNNIFDILEGLAALRKQPFINMGLPRGQVMTDYSRGTEYTHFLAYPASPYRS